MVDGVLGKCGEPGGPWAHLSKLFFPLRQCLLEPAFLGLQPGHFACQSVDPLLLPSLSLFSPLQLFLELLEARFGLPAFPFPLIPTLRKKLHQLSLRTLIRFAIVVHR